MATFEHPAKDPAAVLDYSMDWTGWLRAVSDTISTISVTGSGVTIDSSSQSDGIVTFWASGGTAGETATVTVQIQTAGGRTDERSMDITIVDR